MMRIENSLVSKIDDNQFGANAGVSTTDALAKITHEWFKATDAPEKYVRVLLLDYSKAFDLINHDILIRKLQSIGVKHHIIRWTAGFLLELMQQVRIGNVLSEPGYPNGGVPQGTVSGPKLF